MLLPFFCLNQCLRRNRIHDLSLSDSFYCLYRLKSFKRVSDGKLGKRLRNFDTHMSGRLKPVFQMTQH